MSATADVISTTLSSSAERDAASTLLDARRHADLYASWQSVFERARALEVSDEGSHARESQALRERARSRRDSHEEWSLTALDWTAQRGAPLPTSDVHAIAVAQDGRAIAVLQTPAQRGLDKGAAAATQPLPAHPMHIAAPGAAPALDRSVSAERLAPKPNVQLPTIAAASQPVASESVSVFVKAGAIVVVVRDAQIAEHAALHCAFEAARELSGERSALQQLTLNGRIVYRQCSHFGPPESPALVFTC